MCVCVWVGGWVCVCVCVYTLESVKSVYELPFIPNNKAREVFFI